MMEQIKLPSGHSQLILEPNLEGRDFVVGDIHGCLDQLMAGLDYIGFNDKDRLFSVGDLIDRGPKNLEVLRMFLDTQNFFFVEGNHEDMMKCSHGDRATADADGTFTMWLQNGGAWALDYYNKGEEAEAFLEYDALVKRTYDIPVAITVKNQEGRAAFHVMHAGILHAETKQTDIGILNGLDPFTVGAIDFHGLDKIIWNREPFYNFHRFPQNVMEIAPDILKTAVKHAYEYCNHEHLLHDKLSPILVGHNVVRRPMKLLGHINIDTGSYFQLDSYRKHLATVDWPGLTIVEPATMKAIKVNFNNTPAVEKVDILDLDALMTPEDLKELQ